MNRKISVEKRRLWINILISSILFTSSIFMGFTSDFSAISIIEGLVELSRFLTAFPPPILAVLIFLNNFIKSLLVILLGFLIGIPPIVFLIFNGLILGAVARYGFASIGFTGTLASILPHGIIELPSVLVASALGLNVGWEAWIGVLGKESRVKTVVVRSLKIFFKVITPLLAVAAFIEVFITPIIYGFIAYG
ncbi:stage II sporulation protein M [Candidatus Bathyarchaeota archaeon]|nr:stage II sporulation protein M [Candidatus Bathyarchaeota archaeon]MBS7613292.1 stage II sporulation protein M [Candidatus Bathyarchaeota archaeon]MBS7618431.1 stage II sporulation protein M [Candidatus Bathyarchaeota archaeon]